MRAWTIRGVGPLCGIVRVPGDKSISHRALLLAALARGDSTIRGLSRGEDVLRTATALRALGVAITERGPDEVVVRGRGPGALREPEDVLDLGNSGTSMRLLAGILSGLPFLSVLTGDASLRSRPMDRVIEPLSRMGARILARGQGTRAPLTIQGAALSGIRYPMPVASAQVKSCVLLAGLLARGETTVVEPAPTRDHTERMLAHLGVEIRKRRGEIRVRGGAPLVARDIDVPGDLSAAAFFLVAGTLVPGSILVLEGVGVNPGRTGILRALAAMGARIRLSNRRLQAGEPVADLRVKSARLTGIDVPPEWVPSLIDEVPVLAVAAALAEGTTRIRGAGELRLKESDRLAAMARNLRALGVPVRETKDGLTIRGTPSPRAGVVESFGDHRVAMALAVLALRARGTVNVRDVECVETSFPGFAALLGQAGAEVGVRGE